MEPNNTLFDATFLGTMRLPPIGPFHFITILTDVQTLGSSDDPIDYWAFEHSVAGESITSVKVDFTTSQLPEFMEQAGVTGEERQYVIRAEDGLVGTGANEMTVTLKFGLSAYGEEFFAWYQPIVNQALELAYRAAQTEKPDDWQDAENAARLVELINTIFEYEGTVNVNGRDLADQLRTAVEGTSFVTSLASGFEDKVLELTEILENWEAVEIEVEGGSEELGRYTTFTAETVSGSNLGAFSTSGTATLTGASGVTYQPVDFGLLTVSLASGIGENTISILPGLLVQEHTGADSTLFITIEMTNAADVPISVGFAIEAAGDNPVSADDFAGGLLPSGRITINPGQELGTASVLIAGDMLAEGNETFVVRIFDVDPVDSHLVIGQATATGTIFDDEVDVPVQWYLQVSDIGVAAATYQFFTGAIPGAGGFAFLISSSENPNDLNDPYYGQFNIENRYINFASNLGTASEVAATFEATFGALSYEEALTLAYEEIVGKPLEGGSRTFFLNAEAYYKAVAAERVVRPGVDLDLATKIVAIGSILNEAVKAGDGPYASAIALLTEDVAPDGMSSLLGGDMLSMV